MKLKSLDFEFKAIINDFNKNKFDYEEEPPASEIEIQTPINIESLRSEYFSLEDKKCSDERLLNLYFIWDLASSLVLYLEKYRGSTTINYWGDIDPLRNPLKTRLLINKAGFAYEKDLFHTYRKPLANCHFAILEKSFSIARHCDQFESSQDSSFAHFIKKENTYSFFNDIRFFMVSLGSFEDLNLLNYEMCELLNTKIGVPIDPEVRSNRSKKALISLITGKEELKEKYIEYFQKYKIDILKSKRYPHDKFILTKKFNGVTQFYQSAEEDLESILLKYQFSARDKKYNYALKTQPKNISSSINKWKSEDENFRESLGRICKLRKA